MSRPFVLVLLVGPVLAATALLAVIAGGEHVAALGIGDRPRNVAEAAAMGNASEVVRLIHAGQDPRRIYPVRAEVISSSVPSATGLEAAMWSRTLAMIELLDRDGFIADPAVRRHLSCLARDLELPEIAGYLSRSSDAPCAPDEGLARLRARTAAR